MRIALDDKFKNAKAPYFGDGEYYLELTGFICKRCNTELYAGIMCVDESATSKALWDRYRVLPSLYRKHMETLKEEGKECSSYIKD